MPIYKNGQVFTQATGLEFPAGIEFPAASELTISSGEITATQQRNIVDGEGDADDYLHTINGLRDGNMLVLKPASSSRSIWLTSGIGNIVTPTGSTYRLPDNAWTSMMYDGTNWFVFSEPKSIRWLDAKVPISSTKLGGSKDPNYIKVLQAAGGSQGVFTYAFDPTSEEEIYFVLQMNHDYKSGTNLHAHVHWMPSANGAAGQKVGWGLEYVWSEIGSVFGNTALAAGNVPVPNDTSLVQHKHYLTEIVEINGSEVDTVSSMLICRLFRDATGSIVTDDYPSDAYLLEVDMHYQIDDAGSVEEYVKY